MKQAAHSDLKFLVSTEFSGNSVHIYSLLSSRYFPGLGFS